MNLKPWNQDLKHLRTIILKEDKIEESKKTLLKFTCNGSLVQFIRNRRTNI